MDLDGDWTAPSPGLITHTHQVIVITHGQHHLTEVGQAFNTQSLDVPEVEGPEELVLEAPDVDPASLLI